MAKRRHKKKEHLVHPLLSTTLALTALSGLTIYGVDCIRDMRKEDVELRTVASGFVQKEKYSRDMKNEMINFDNKYEYTTTDNLPEGKSYTDGTHLCEQLTNHEIRCCLINGEYYSLNGETIMYYYHEVREDLVKEGIVYPKEDGRIIIPKGVDFSECELITSHYYTEIDPNLIITQKELEKTMKLVLEK